MPLLVPDRGETPTWGLLGECSVVLLGACHVLRIFHFLLFVFVFVFVVLLGACHVLRSLTFLLSIESKDQYQIGCYPVIASVLRAIIGLHEFMIADHRV